MNYRKIGIILLIAGILLCFGGAMFRPGLIPRPLLDKNGAILTDESGRPIFDEDSAKEVRRVTLPYDIATAGGFIMAICGIILIPIGFIVQKKKK